MGTSLTPPSTALRSFLARSLGLPKKIDELGNVFLTLPSQRPGNPAIALGGALDTPSPLPVLAALEVVRTLQEGSVLPVAPITLIGWSCTSGSRFPRALLGSGAWAGEVGVEEAWGLRETGEGEGRRTVKACLREGGWLGDAECSVQEGAELGVYFSAATGRGGIRGLGCFSCRWRGNRDTSLEPGLFLWLLLSHFCGWVVWALRVECLSLRCRWRV